MDSHHILYPRQEYSLRPDAKWLRTREELVPDIDADVHKELHKVCPPVPLLGYHALRRVVKYFEPVEGDPLASMDELIHAIEQTNRDTRSHALERQVGKATAWAVNLQRPFIREGMVDPDRTIIDLGA